MLRITEIDRDDEKITFLLEGRIVGQWVDEFSKECETALAGGHRIILDLSRVLFADEQGIDTLNRLIGERIELTGCSLFLSELLDQHTQIRKKNL
jgi:anti-anti-sigma regulatory factor